MSAADKFAFVDQSLRDRHLNHRWRSLIPLQPDGAVHLCHHGRRLLNFSGNDYLGLSKHPAVIQVAQAYAQEYGAGATASRLVTGTLPIHAQLEADLALACEREAALVLNSGFQANTTLLATLLDRQSLVLSDRLCHSSLVQGMVLSRARLQRYRHNDLNQLEERLKQAQSQPYNRIVIVSETVFSMDGDRTDVAAIARLAEQYNAILYLDDAHAVGVLGRNGMGLAVGQAGVDVVLGTFGKAFGAFGAFVAGAQRLKDYWVNGCPGLIYTTALPPAVIGAISAALALMPELEPERHHLADLAERLRRGLQGLGYDTGASSTQIVPIGVGDEARALKLSAWLEEHGIWATAIRPPTVPVGTARIRIALSSQHQIDHVDYLLHTLEQWPG